MINAYIELSDSHKFGKYNETAEGNILKKNVEVIFKSGEQEIVKEFTFTDVNNNLLLLSVQ